MYKHLNIGPDSTRLWLIDLDTGERLGRAFAGGVDNTTLDAGSGGDTIATDDILGVKYQRVKIVEGADGSNDGDVSSANPLPVDVSDSATRDLGKVDIAGLDQYTPIDVDTGAGVENAFPVTVRVGASGGSTAQTYNAGNADAGTQRVVLATDQAVLSVDDNAGSLTVDNAALSVTGGGVQASALRVTIASDSTGVVSIDDNGSTVSVDDGAGSLTIDGTVTADAGTGTFTSGGVAAHDAAVSGNPVLVGGEAHTANPTAVADGDAVRIACDDQGKVLTSPHGPRDLVNIQQTNLANTTETTIVTAAVSTFHDIACLTVHNAGSALNQVTIRDSTLGTVRFVIQLAADGGGTVVQPCIPIPQAVVNNNWTAQASVAGDVDITVVYIKRT